MTLKCIPLLLIAILSMNAFKCKSQIWEEVQSFPGIARDDGSTFTINNMHYCGLGMDAGFSCTRDFYYFDGSSLNWNSSTSLPMGEERQYTVACSWNGKGYIFGGLACGGIFLNDLWIFDPLNSTWTEGVSLPAEGRSGAEHFILGDTLYIVGGKNSNGIISEVWGLDLTNNIWSQKNDYPGDGIWRGLSFGWNAIGYAGMGKNNLNSQTEFNTELYSYNPIFDTWNLETNPGISPSCYIGSAQKDSLVLIYGGLDPTNTMQTTLNRLDISNWNLTSLPDFTDDPRKGVMSFLVDDDFYLTCGVSQTQRLNETWKIIDILEVDQSEVPEFSMSPNPCSDHLNLRLLSPNNSQMYIYALEGKVVKIIHLAGSTIQEVNLSDLKSGTYFIRINSTVRKLEILK